MVRIQILVISILCLALFAGAAPQKPQSAEAMMGTALRQEEVEGNLEAAIATYKKVLAAKGTSRAVAARALYHIGLCYEKLGNAEARKTFERLIKEYADQTDIAGQASTRLTALGSAESKSTDVAIRKIWAQPDEATFIGPPSPDGRYIAYEDCENIDLAIHDLLTGTNRRLTSGDPKFHIVENSVWSPDGTMIAYNWRASNSRTLSISEIRVIKLDGSAPRTVYVYKDYHQDQDLHWLPDGKSLLAGLWKKGGMQFLARIFLDDSPPQVFQTPGRRGHESLSPDGRFIAYNRPKDEDSSDTDIYCIPIAGGSEVAIVSERGAEKLFGWDPDGWSILFTSKRSGSFDLWRIRVAEGKPQGEAELVKSDLGDVDPLGSTPKGSFFYGRGQVIRNVYVATLDMASGGIVTTPVLVSTAHVGSADSPAWSPDGNYLAYLAPAYKGFVVSGGAGKLCILSLKDGRQREFDLAYEYHIQDDAHLSWSPDGQSILASSFARGVCRIDTRTGEVSTAAAINGLIADWSPDANTVYTVRPWMSDSRPAVVLSHDAASGQEKELYHSVERISLPIAGRPLSPDGKWLAVGRFVQKEDTATRPIKILLIPTSGGEARELVTIEAPQGLLDFCWTPDGKHIVYSQYNRKGGFTSTVELWEIFMEGGTPRKLGLSMGWLHQVSFHPDGKRIAFTAGGQSWYDVWVIENLPPLKASR